MFDRVVALFALVVTAPFLLLVMILVYLDLRWPVFYVAERAGLHGEPFRMYKFRTMNQRRDSNGVLLPDIDRISFLGNVLRKSSVDELPGLLNVVLGHMRLVGPRPLPVDYISKYTGEQTKRLLVPPGLTGLAQVSGRNSITWRRKFRYDVFYVQHRSFCLDLAIIFKTVRVLFDYTIVNSDKKETMKRFEG